MSSASKRLESATGLLQILQEFPMTKVNDISIRRIPKKASLHSTDETRVKLHVDATNASTGEGSIMIEVTGVPGKAVHSVMINAFTANRPQIQAVYARDFWSIRIPGEFSVGLNTDGNLDWTSFAPAEYKKQPSEASIKAAQNHLRAVGERILLRLSRVDMF